MGVCTQLLWLEVESSDRSRYERIRRTSWRRRSVSGEQLNLFHELLGPHMDNFRGLQIHHDWAGPVSRLSHVLVNGGRAFVHFQSSRSRTQQLDLRGCHHGTPMLLAEEIHHYRRIKVPFRDVFEQGHGWHDQCENGLLCYRERMRIMRIDYRGSLDLKCII